MSKKRVKAPESEAGYGLHRRAFLGASAALLLHPLWARADAPGELPAETRSALGKSGFVYVSPLRSDGSESSCHGEVWYSWLDGAVHLTTARTTWKARSLARGLDRARIWVGDHGRWKRVVGRSEAFRKAPHFDSRVRELKDPAVVRRLLADFAVKYPAEFPSWKERMERGHASGERLLLRYDPV